MIVAQLRGGQFKHAKDRRLWGKARRGMIPSSRTDCAIAWDALADIADALGFNVSGYLSALSRQKRKLLQQLHTPTA